MMPKNLDELIETYQERLRDKDNPPGSQELAELEDEIWNAHKLMEGVGTTKKEGGERRDWFTSKFGGRSTDYERRSTLWNAGQWAWVCFEKIDKEVYNYNSATHLLRAVKQVARNTGAPMSEVMRVAVDLFDGTHMRTLEGLEEAVVKRGKKAPSTTKVVSETGPYSPNPTASSKEFKARIQKVVHEYLEHLFRKNPVTDYYKGQLEDEFMASIDVTVDELRKNIQSSKRYARNEILTSVNQSDFELACEVLGLTLLYGDPIDAKTERLITRRFQSRAGALHPDAKPGERDEFELVVKAHETMKQYVRIRKEAT
jgi:hypothetical protein